METGDEFERCVLNIGSWVGSLVDWIHETPLAVR